MGQDPKITVEWALHGLEAAIRRLGDGPPERRVRRQFHQVLLAVERDTRLSADPGDTPADNDSHALKTTERGPWKERRSVLVV